MSAGAFADPQQNLQSTIGLDQNLAYSRTTIQDSEFLDEEATQFMPKAAQNVRNYRILTKDVDPVTGSDVMPFNAFTTFKYGNEGMPNLAAAELQMMLPRLIDNTSGSSKGNPADATYTGTGTFLNWVPYVAERIHCGSGEPCRQRHATENLRSYTAEVIHCKRALCMDAYGTARRAAYNNSVGAVAQGTATPQFMRIPIWLAHNTDDVNFHQLLPVQGFATEFNHLIKVPALTQLIQTDITNAATNVIPDPNPSSVITGLAAQPNGIYCFLRLLYVVVEKAERGTYANMLLTRDGLTYQTMQVARETIATTTVAGATTVTIPIKNSLNPCVAIVWIVRMVDDTVAVGTVSTNSTVDLNVPPRSISVGGVVTVVRPNWVNFQPWLNFALFDGGSRVLDQRSQDDFLNSIVQGFTNYFPGDLATNIGVQVLGAFPTIENHGMGHMSLLALQVPKLVIGLPALTTTETNSGTGATRQIDVFYWERNLSHMSNGAIIRQYQVLD